MTTLTHLPELSVICQTINDKNPDCIRIRHYPSYNDLTSTNKTNHCNKILCTNELNNTDNTKLLKYLSDKPVVVESVTEFGMKDTFVRITSSIKKFPEKSSNTRMFFRRELYMLDNLTNTNGIYIIELYKECAEEELPYVVSYEHNLYCFETIYTLSEKNYDIKLCLTEPSNKSNNNFESYISIYRDINTLTVDTLTNFFDDITSLKSKLNTT